MQANYQIAGHTVCIDSVFEEVHLRSKSYATQAAAELVIRTTRQDIEKEKLLCGEENEEAALLPDSMLELTAVYRKLIEAYSAFDVLFFHGSAVAVDGAAYLFIAVSGTGKSTHTRMWRQLLGERAVMVNDDKPLVHIAPDHATVYGTPWNGKHRLDSNVAVPLKAICVLKRGTENEIKPLTLAQVYPMLLQQTYRNDDVSRLQQTMQLLDTLADSVSFYEMHCNISTDAAKMAYEYMSSTDSERKQS